MTAWQYRRLATHVITTGDSISAHLVKELGLPPERVSCISTGISPPPELPSREASREEIARELGLDEGTRFVGQVSVLRGWKGTTDLIAAFESFAAARPKFHLLIIGDGPQRQALATTIASSRFASRMHLLGHRENPWRYFAGMEVCALCSTASEGIPQALMQAMCAGTSVVGTSVGGIPEVVLHGVTGLIVPPASPAELARAIQECLDDIDRSEAMRKAASEMIRNTRTLDHMGDSVTAIIRRDLAANGRR